MIIGLFLMDNIVDKACFFGRDENTWAFTHIFQASGTLLLQC